jgi:hypothetical protein
MQPFVVFIFFNVTHNCNMSIHESMNRLYQAALELGGIKGQSAVARALDCSPQVVQNWEKRGISNKAALSAERIFGCSARWIMDGTGEMSLLDATDPACQYDGLIKDVIKMMLKSDEQGQLRMKIAVEDAFKALEYQKQNEALNRALTERLAQFSASKLEEFKQTRIVNAELPLTNNKPPRKEH